MSWSYLQTGAVGQDALPAFQAGHAGFDSRRPLQLLTFFDLAFP